MRNYFIFDGVPSLNYGAYIASSNMFDAPKKDYSTVSVIGRNGLLHIDNGRFEAFNGKCTVYIPYDMQTTIDGLRNFLVSRGTCRYMEYLRPEEYRLATFTNAFEVKGSDRRGAYFELQFTCSPERWLVDGEMPIAVSSSKVIMNRTMFNAKPLIEVVGTGTVDINGSSLTLANNTSTAYIDCDVEDAYEGTINRNSDLTVTNGFPVLEPGQNTVTVSGFTSCNIIPRWWIV